MPRKYRRKSERGSWDEKKMREAIDMMQGGAKMKRAADACGVPRTTLRRHFKNLLCKPVGSKHLGNLSVLGQERELDLVKHITDFERRGFPLTTADIRKLAYQFVIHNNIKHSFNDAKKMAGRDWCSGFRKRHRNILTIRKPQALSIQRAIHLNKPSVEKYFQILERIMEENNLFGKPTRIYNVDETGLSLVPGVKKIVGRRGMNGSSQITGGERGQLQTVIMATSAAGDYIPPMIIYKGKRMLPELEKGFPPGTVVHLSESGYVNKDLFLDWFKHFCKNKKDKDGKTLLVLDGHGSHTLNLDVVHLAAEHGVEIVSMPPHTSHYLQPLDKVHFKPLKEHYKEAVRIHLRNNPGLGIKRSDFPTLFRTAYFKVATISNSINAFRATGLYPLNIDEIPDYAYAPAETTNCFQTPNTDSVACHASSNRSTESNITVESLQAEEAVLNQPVENSDAIGRLPQESENVTTQTLQKERAADSAAVDSNTSLESNETVTDMLQNSNNSDLNETSFETILPFPTIRKTVMRKKKAITTGSRILTSKSYRSELKSYLDSKQNQKKQNTTKKQTTETFTKKTPASRSEKNCNPSKRKKKQVDRNDQTNICGFCQGNYYDDTNVQDAESWIQCPVCHLWYHETCAGVYGKTAFDFVCSDCN